MRETDTAARLGGDEFAIRLAGLSCRRGAIHAAEKILHKMEEDFSCGKRTFNITASIGICLPDGGETDIGRLLKQAGQAL